MVVARCREGARASARARRPAAFLFARPPMEGRKIYSARNWDALWEAEPAFSQIWRTSSLIWGTGMLAAAAEDQFAGERPMRDAGVHR